MNNRNSLYLLAALSTLGLSLAVGIQPLFLEEVIAIPYERSGVINADVLVVAEIVSILLVGMSGYSSI